MIRTNLSTRPFYNERVVRVWTLAVAGLVALATVFNVTQVLRYSTSNTELATQASTNEARAVDLRRRAQSLRASVDAAQVDTVSADAQQANELIDRRTFSWTELFNRFERTLPDEVRITAVRPTLDRDRRIVLSIGVLAKGVDDVNQFMENLDETGAFFELRVREEITTDEGQIQSVLETVYQPPTAAPDQPAVAPRGGAR